MDSKEIIARRAALELKDGELVNLGIGLPTMVADYLPEGVEVTLQSENGMVGMGHLVNGDHNRNLTNAGGHSVQILPHGACFDSAFSFALIRGGHVDTAILGTLEVDEKGDIANYMIPGKMVPGMGGAMDLVTGAKRVIVITTHTDKNGKPKILKKCNLPLTGVSCGNLIITELAVISVTSEGLKLLEVAENSSIDEVVEKTEATLLIDREKVKTFKTS